MQKFDLRLGTYYRYQLLKHFDLFHQIKKTHRVLDVGGYDGYLLSRLNSRSKTLIDINIKKNFQGIKYIKNDFLDQSFKHSSFDYIFSFDVLEHIPNGKEKQFIQKIVDLLKKNCWAYITIPSKSIKVFPHFLTSWVSKKWGHDKCLGYSKKDLNEFLRQTKTMYKIIELHAPGYLNLYLLIRFMQKLIPNNMITFILDKLAQYDYRHHQGANGYFLIKIKKL